MKVISVNIGQPEAISWHGKTVMTSILKRPVSGRIKAKRLNLEGDAQADLLAHGGEHRAVFVYQKESYEFWRNKLQRTDLQYGQLGENLTIEGLPDSEVCIGDRFKIGTAIFEVTQPRVTCFKLGISVGIPQMASLLVKHGRPGFYFRVIGEGELSTDDEMIKIADGPGQMNIVQVDGLLYSGNHPLEELERVLKIPALSQGWRGSFEAIYTDMKSGSATKNGGLVMPEARATAWPGFREMVTAGAEMISEDVRMFHLRLADGQELPLYTAGQHLAVRLRINGQVQIRMYSLCAPTGSDFFRIAVKRENQGAASNFLHDHIRPGDLVECSAPRGTFTLEPDAKPVILISAGIGVTPVLAMLYAAAAENHFPRIWWLYTARNSGHHLFRKEVEEIGAQLNNFKKLVFYSRPDEGDIKHRDYDQEGHLALRTLRDHGVPADANFYMCGPASFLSDLSAALKAYGVAASAIHFEAFGNTAVINDNGKVPHLPEGEIGQGPDIILVKSKLSFKWHPRFENLLEAVEACDVPASWACRTGVCHRCEVTLFNGDVNYITEPIDLPSPGNVLICCSVPKTAIEINL